MGNAVCAIITHTLIKPFPSLLRQIDQVVDAVGGHEVLCFLEVYKGYWQILMAPEDMKKMAFVTNNSIFCYTRMLSGLKNAQAKFQHMVNDIFCYQIGRNMEV